MNWESKQIFPEKLFEKVASIRVDGKTIVTLNGSFDLLHAGHLYIIDRAAEMGDYLLLMLNSDASIKKYKNLNRPLITLKYRLQMVASLAAVDYVTWFEETDPCQMLEVIKPDVHVNGEEYGKDCIEAQTVQKCGGQIHIVPRIPNLSTSQIIEKIKALP